MVGFHTHISRYAMQETSVIVRETISFQAGGTGLKQKGSA